MSASDWRADAACTDLPELHTGRLAPTDVREAVEICRRCPVVGPCDHLAREVRPSWGVWAGRLRTGGDRG